MYFSRVCQNLESIKIPEGIENIYAKTFINCQSLKEVIFPSTLKKLEFFAFANCDLLKKNIFPEGVEEIDVDNKSIENLILPSTIKEIFIATTGFTSLKKLYLHVNDTVNYSNMYSNGLLDNINNIEEIVLIYNTTPDLIAFINRPSNKSFLFLSLKQSNSNYKLKLVGPSLSLPEYLLVFGNLPNKSKISFVNPDKIPDETETKLYKYVKESKLNKLINKIYQDTAYLPRKTKVAINKEIEEQLEECNLD